MFVLGLFLDNFIYGVFIKFLCDVGRFYDVKDVFLSMEGNGCILDLRICNLFVDIFVKLD